MEMTNQPNQYVFGLDIGTRSVVGTVGYKNRENRFQVVAQVSKEHETRAMLDGQIHNIEAVSHTIAEVKEKLENTLGFELEEVCIAAAGRVLKTVTVTAEYSFEQEQTISKEMVHSLEMLGVEQAYDKLKRKSKDGFHYYCVGYTVVKSYLNDYLMLSLEEHKGSKISADILATFLPEEVIDGLYKAVEKAGLKVSNLTLEPIAAMEVAIPENIRLLNLALVDVGAGTSDISVTKDGSIIAFGMIPFAGDEITENIAKKYLVDFNAAEEIKRACLEETEITYTDILGFPHELKANEVVDGVQEVVEHITKKIADKIISLNGGKSVSAVFVVGGGGKLPTFISSLASHLDLPVERVALRGKEVLMGVDFLELDIQKDSTLVTPIGICLNYYEKRNNFVYVTVNGEVVKLYDNNRLTVLDAALSVGISTMDLFPRRGKNLCFTLNGEQKVIKGLPGEAAVISLNKKEANMSAPIASHDVVDIVKSTAGMDGCYTLQEVVEDIPMRTFQINGIAITCPSLLEVNKSVVGVDYVIQPDDKIKVLNYYSLSQLLKVMDIPYQADMMVNGTAAAQDTPLYDNYELSFSFVEAAMMEEETKESAKKPETQKNTSMQVNVNGQTMLVSGKMNYIMVDILDAYGFDPTPAMDKKLILRKNDIEADFTTPVEENDEISLFWI